ncbi:hypothetical protein KC331_g18827 [Hortaea werneckii]|nr:hypothetical protein KC331_g18827 [Hortaea werneckii]KAI7698661.1 hypothetical protein KC353_g16852 [Hortaea werneckii]
MPRTSLHTQSAISDHESGSEEDIPDQIPARVDKKATEPTQDEEEDDNDEDDDDEDEYRVEKIVKHDWLDDGTLVYQIKWQGYEDPGDMTWEPVENLEGAKDILQTYLKKIGGTPEPPSPKTKRGGSTRKSGGGKRSASEAFATDSPAPASSSKKRGASSSKGRPSKANGTVDDTTETTKRALPPGTWDNDVLRVTSIIEESAPSSTTTSSSARNKSAAAGNGKESKELIGLLEWKDGGAKTQHKMKVLRQKVPQRLLDYYEQHLVFTDAGANNQTDTAANKNEDEEDQEEDVEMK